MKRSQGKNSRGNQEAGTEAEPRESLLTDLLSKAFPACLPSDTPRTTGTGMALLPVGWDLTH